MSNTGTYGRAYDAWKTRNRENRPRQIWVWDNEPMTRNKTEARAGRNSLTPVNQNRDADVAGTGHWVKV